jgi:hypothetical protein
VPWPAAANRATVSSRSANGWPARNAATTRSLPTVAAAMLDEAEHPRYRGAIAVPLER